MKLVQFVLRFGRSRIVRSGNLPGIVIRASWCAAVGLFCLFSAFRAWSAECVLPPPGLVAWWPGEGNADDIIGTNNGTLEGGVIFTNGEVGQAFSFDGSTGYVQVPDTDLWAFGNSDFTIELWGNWNVAPEGYSVFIGNDEGVPGRKWIFSLVGGFLEFTIQNPPASPVFLVQAPFTPIVNQWYPRMARS